MYYARICEPLTAEISAFKVVRQAGRQAGRRALRTWCGSRTEEEQGASGEDESPCGEKILDRTPELNADPVPLGNSVRLETCRVALK